MTTITEMRVHMDCPGCEAKVRSTLQKLKGVDTVEIDMLMQKVTVTGWADQKKILKTVRKTGRRAEIWQLPFVRSNLNSSFVYNQTQCNGPINNYSPQPSSSYNYYKHGYDTAAGSSANYGYNQNPAHSSVYGYQPTTAFSDENPNGVL